MKSVLNNFLKSTLFREKPFWLNDLIHLTIKIFLKELGKIMIWVFNLLPGFDKLTFYVMNI